MTPQQSGEPTGLEKAMSRYSAKLLFQFRVDLGQRSGKHRLCEERIILIEAETAASALASAKSTGKTSEYSYENDDGNEVHFEFVGVMELLELGLECDEDEVWYEVSEKLSPMERRSKLIPAESALNAFRVGKQGKRKPSPG